MSALEISELSAILASVEEGGWYPLWRDLAEEGAVERGYTTIAVVEGEDRRWSRTNRVIVKAPSGALYAWYYEHPLTETGEYERGSEDIVEVVAETRVIEVVDYITKENA